MLATVMDKLPRRSQKVLALDWDAHMLKAVEATLQKSTLRINRVISAAIPPEVKTSEPGSFGPFIRQVLADKKFSTRRALLAIPRDKVILINLRLPTGSVGDLSSMVRLQASRELPFSADEAVMDFAGSTVHDAPEFLDVTVGAIQRDVLKQYQELAAVAGLTLIRMGLRPNSNLLSIVRGVQPFVDDRILFVDIGAQATEINIFRWGRLTYSRSVSINVETHAPADDSAGRPLLLEVLRTVEAYRATDPNKLDQVVIAGDTGLEGWLAEALRSRISAPASLYDPTWTIAIEKDRAEQMTGFAAVLGLLVGQMVPPLSRFDFHSPKKPADMAAIRRKQIIGGATAALVLILGIWMASSLYLGSLRQEKARLESHITALKKQAAIVDVVSKRVGTAQKWMKQDVVWVDKLREVVEQMPENSQAYTTKVSIKATSSTVPNGRDIQMGLRMNDWQVSKTFQDSLGSNAHFIGIIGPSRTTGDPKYGYTGDMTVIIPPEKDKDKLAGKGAKPAAASQPATRPVLVEPDPLAESSESAHPAEEASR